LLISPVVSAKAEEAAVYTTTMVYYVQNIGANQALNVRATIYLFDNLSGWADQVVVSEAITVDGVPVSPPIVKTEDNRWTQVPLGELSPGQTKQIKVVQVMKVGAVDLKIDPSNVGTDVPQDPSVYTQPVSGLFESDDPLIQSLARRLTENTSNLYYKARQVFDFVVENPENDQHLRYQRQSVDHSALWALQNKVGDCTEFSNLFVALARAAGIPAKVVSGYAYLPLYNPAAATDADELGHAYVIFYLPSYGWVPADAVWPSYQGSFGKLDYAHIAGASTDGNGVVRPDRWIWPGPGVFSWNWQQYLGEETELTGSHSGTITPEILVQSTIQTPSQMSDDRLSVTLTVKNMGKSPANDLVAQLNLDSTYFEVITGPQKKATLATMEQWVVNFDVKVRSAAYGTTQKLNSEVTFNSSDGSVSGTFLSTGQAQVTIGAKVVPPPTDSTTLYIVIAAAAVAVVVLAVFLKRR
jgi:hypothetical protein